MQALQPTASSLQRAASGAASGRRCAPARRACCAAPRLRSQRGGSTRSPAATPVSGAATTADAYRRLQNGSDVRGVALPGVAGQDVTLTPERCAPRLPFPHTSC